MMDRTGNLCGKGVLPVNLLLLLAGIALITPLMAEKSANDRLWDQAQLAYRNWQFETGHLHIKSIIDNNPFDVELAVKCLEKIVGQARRHHVRYAKNRRDHAWRRFYEDRWAQYAARRLCALEHIGAVSARNRNLKDAFKAAIEYHIRQGHPLEAFELIGRVVKENPNDPFWRISLAHFYRRLDSSRTRQIYAGLKAEMDLDHPDPSARQHWTWFAEELDQDRKEFPPEIQPVPKGSPLSIMDPVDPDAEWGFVAARPARKIAEQIDRLAGKAQAPDAIIPWKDGTGLTDPARALDLHLLSQPKADLVPLRIIQTRRLAHEELPSRSSAAETLALFRRYPWALQAQQRLLAEANRMLWSGRVQPALRCFRELLDHAIDAKLLNAAQVGYWIALSQTGNAGTAEELVGDVNPDRSFPWMGGTAKASEICERLIGSRPQPTAADASPLKGLVQHVVHIPPISPWSSDLPAMVDLAVSSQGLLVSGRNVLALYKPGDLNRPVWSSLHRHPAEARRRRNDLPGYFRPLLDGSVLYTRWGFSSVPLGIAAIEHATGHPLWSNERPPIDTRGRRMFSVPMGDPVTADGLLYYLQWNAEGNVNHNRGRSLSLVCFDPQRREHVWESIVAQAGTGSDVIGSLERARAESAIYGNRVTIHEGAVYSSSNCGIVARSDVRNGRTDWVYCYLPRPNLPNVMNLGSEPVIAGDNVILMPRDSSRIFALDQRTGRLVWENSLVLGVQIVGIQDDLLIVLGQATIAGLDLKTGEVRWYQPLVGPAIGRALFTATSIYLAQPEALLRLDARTGRVVDTRPWDLDDERPLSFTIHGRDLYVVTDKPGSDPEQKVARTLNPSMPAVTSPLSLPMRRAWSLHRDNARVTLPPEGSVLYGKGYLISRGILECFDVSARGGIRWQRFVDTRNSRIHFAGKTMLVIDSADKRFPGTLNRVVAYDATDGRSLWEHILHDPIQKTFNCGAIQIFQHSRNRIVAVNLLTGRKAWEHNLGQANLMGISAEEKHIQVFFSSHQRIGHHQVLDAKSGRMLSDNLVVGQPAPGDNAKALKDGYYEVRFKPVRARYVRIVALSEVSGGNWASIADFQVTDAQGKNLPRQKWKTLFCSSFENKTSHNAVPEKAFDESKSSWWHSQWMGGVPPHPHEIQIDMGASQPVAGIRYLPAVIINDNGMIKDYAFYVSQNGKNWGKPVAAGVLVNRTQINRSFSSAKAILFESHDRPTRTNNIYHYAMDGKSARLIQKNSRIILFRWPYYITTIRNAENHDELSVYRLDNASYKFDLGTTRQFDTRSMEITGDRLVAGSRILIVADLSSKKWIVPPGDHKLKHNRDGLVVRIGQDNLMKIIHFGHQGHTIFNFDLRTGKQTEYALTSQIERIQAPHHRDGPIPRFDSVLLLNDSSSITAWIAVGSASINSTD